MVEVIITADFTVYVNDLLGNRAVEAFQVALAALTGYIAITKLLKDAVFGIFSTCTDKLIESCSKPFHMRLAYK